MRLCERRANLLLWVSGQLDYWTPYKDRCREAEEQHAHYTNMMKFLVTGYEQEPMRERPQGTSPVFPSL